MTGAPFSRRAYIAAKFSVFLIANELYTKKELEKYGMTSDGFIEMDIPKNRVFHNFGVRFEKKD